MQLGHLCEYCCQLGANGGDSEGQRKIGLWKETRQWHLSACKSASPVPYCLLQPLRAAVWEERAAPAAGGKWEEWEEEEGRAPGGWEPASLSAPFLSPLQLCFCSSPRVSSQGLRSRWWCEQWLWGSAHCLPPPCRVSVFIRAGKSAVTGTEALQRCRALFSLPPS